MRVISDWRLHNVVDFRGTTSKEPNKDLHEITLLVHVFKTAVSAYSLTFADSFPTDQQFLLLSPIFLNRKISFQLDL